MKVSVKTLDNKASGEVTLDKDVFGVEVREDLLQRAVLWQRNKKRAGTHKTKGISEVRGTGAKPYRQKGTGRARFGSLRTPIHRGGAIIFGPVVRSHATDLPKKVRKLALKSALSAKAKEGKIVVLDKVEAKSHKTKEMAAQLKALGLESAVILGAEAANENFVRATRNIPLIDLLPQAAANVYDILHRDVLVITKAALEDLQKRLK